MTTALPPLPPLPPDAAELLRAVEAPPRLVAHLALVHQVAEQIAEFCAAEGLAFDREAVRFGAATHDIGKVVHPEELSGPGSAHEPAGRALLLTHGVAEPLARFARSHASWGEPGITTEELLVSLADKAWKNQRVRDLEDLVIDRLAGATGRERWETFLALDDLLTRIGEDAPRRLALQAAHPVRTGRN
ncbi:MULTISPECIES: HD domain-containing protein [Kitasatospora]|uniref:HD domain-containing protein n=1 Tax=Kitasatospora cathayae TaxID=3004092 RepID=A0ABY7QBI4_9ACTN|nr:HD domain-containing protein [Kitasatospora sp. HUAS 3-15]WBP89824.1 HD domain-containing protein [Kitasatospora sp. HUAS 3-15]